MKVRTREIEGTGGRVLCGLHQFIRRNGYLPSMRDLVTMGVARSESTIMMHIQRLAVSELVCRGEDPAIVNRPYRSTRPNYDRLIFITENGVTRVLERLDKQRNGKEPE